jgi:cyclopropane-fatty-acyl-phospholipid synthase
MAPISPRYAGAEPQAIRHHYDVGDEFYRLWLDPTMTYSCALWSQDDDLQSAQLRKLDHLIAAARGSGAARVLDIGCGWGSGLRRMVQEHDVQTAVGLTLSPSQASAVAATGDPRIEVRVENWADHAPPQPYDAIISIGAFEHFARFGIGRRAKIEAYRRFFMACHKLLAPGGRIALQSICKGDGRVDRAALDDLRFVLTEIFPGSDAPWLAEIATASERVFEIESLRNDRLHYARTVSTWASRLAAERALAVELVGEATTARYERYLVVSEQLFERSQAGLLRIVMRRM